MINLTMIESYKDYGKCVCISNGIVEAYVTVDIGPRIILFGYVGGKNLMCDDRARFAPKTDKAYTDVFGEGKAWESFGGHRIWITPEEYPLTYTPDDEAVDYELLSDGAVFTAKEDRNNNCQKSLEIKMPEGKPEMSVTMRVKNIGASPKEFAVWGITVCDSDGTLIIPMNINDTGLLHNRNISVWPYTDMSDDRIYWGKKYVTVKQDVNAKTPIKLGFDLNGGKAYYVLGEDIFKKTYSPNHPKGIYPDGGCSFETYTNDAMLEFEVLGEVKNVKSGETAEHSECWSLFKKPHEVDCTDDNSIEEFLNDIKQESVL